MTVLNELVERETRATETGFYIFKKLYRAIKIERGRSLYSSDMLYS